MTNPFRVRFPHVANGKRPKSGSQRVPPEDLMNIALDAAQQRLAGEQPSRTRSVLTALMVGAAAAVMTYRLLRRDDGERDDE
jgi:hypothetical protein